MNASLWIETEHVAEPIDDFCNVIVDLPSGERYAFNVWTFDFFAVARSEGDELASAPLRRTYLRPPDLFVADLERPTLEAVVEDLVANGLLPDHCRVEVSDDEDEPT